MAGVKLNSLVKVYSVLLLRKRPMHGYELLKLISAIVGRRVSAGNVYPFLNVLRRNRLIALSSSGKRDRKEYRLTASGLKVARGIENGFAELVDVSFSGKVRVCAHCSCKLVSGWGKKLVNGEELIFCCRRCALAYRRD